MSRELDLELARHLGNVVRDGERFLDIVKADPARWFTDIVEIGDAVELTRLGKAAIESHKELLSVRSRRKMYTFAETVLELMEKKLEALAGEA